MSGRGDGVPTEERSAVEVDGSVELRAGAAGLVAGLGAFFLVSYLSAQASVSLLGRVVEVPYLLLALTLLYAGVWLLRSDFAPRRVGRVAGWSLAGFVTLVAIVVWVGSGDGTALQRSALLTLDVGAVGASTGLLVGLENERRRHLLDRDARAASQAAERAEERFDFFNRLLRHHLLNGLAVIRGHAELLSETHDEHAETVRIIQQRSDEIAALVRNVEILAMAASGDLPRHVVDPVPQLREAAERIHRRHPTAEIELDVEPGTQVVGHDQLELAFEALLRTAVEEAGRRPIVLRTAPEGAKIVVAFEFDGKASIGRNTTRDRDAHDERELGRLLATTLIEYVGGSVDVPVEGRGGIAVRLQSAE